jgi:hypothetical protein
MKNEKIDKKNAEIIERLFGMKEESYYLEESEIIEHHFHREPINEAKHSQEDSPINALLPVNKVHNIRKSLTPIREIANSEFQSSTFKSESKSNVLDLEFESVNFFLKIDEGKSSDHRQNPSAVLTRSMVKKLQGQQNNKMQ